MKTRPTVRTGQGPRVLEFYQPALAAPVPQRRPMAPHAEPPARYAVRAERVIRPDGELWFRWWSDGRLSLSVTTQTDYIELSLRHGDALALLEFMGEVPERPRDLATEAVGA